MIKSIYKNIKIKQLNIFALFAIAVLTVIYLFLANNMAMANYQKTVLIININDLRTEIRKINLELMDKRSVSFLKKAAKDLNLVASENIQYIKVAGAVAKSQ